MSGASCKANGAVYPASSAVMNSAKKPKMEQIQADHELFLQAFESEISPLTNLKCSIAHAISNYLPECLARPFSFVFNLLTNLFSPCFILLSIFDHG